jgi:phosphatidylglycerophosphate synthase
MPTSRPSLAEVRAVTQAGVLERRSAEHWAGRLYMRGVSGHVTRWVVSTRALDRVTPDQLTLLMIVVGLAAAAGVALSATLWAALAACLGIQVYLLLDCVDGEVARWRRTTSARGVYLDRLGHHVVEGALVVALGFRAAGGVLGRSAGEGGLLAAGASWWMVLGAGTALLVIVGKLESDLVVVARATAGLPQDPEADPTSSVGSVRRLRRVFAVLPLHRLIGAVELSLLLVLAAVIDGLRGDLLATQVLLVVTAVVALVVALGHPITILTSRRLR